LKGKKPTFKSEREPAEGEIERRQRERSSAGRVRERRQSERAPTERESAGRGRDRRRRERGLAAKGVRDFNFSWR
jgi:hypothetical protein